MTRISIQATIKLPNEKKVGLRLAYISPQKCGRIMVWVCRCRTSVTIWFPGADPGFQVRGGALKKIAPSGGRRENFWGISCEKSRFYAKKSYVFQLPREARKFLRYFV
jgi:hypothetical protein